MESKIMKQAFDFGKIAKTVPKEEVSVKAAYPDLKEKGQSYLAIAGTKRSGLIV